MARSDQLSRISRAIGRRKLVWLGIRGHDAMALRHISQFEDCFAVTAPLEATQLRVDTTLEELTGVRVDLDTYEIDDDQRPELLIFRGMLLESLNSDCVVATYRPSHFLSNAHFASLQTAEYLGLFKERQAAFEHKPWVETQLARCGVQTIPWRYIAEERRDELSDFMNGEPIILRASRSSGGTGVVLLSHIDELDQSWEVRPDSLIAVGPFLRDCVSINVGACVFPDGTVTVHPASFQLIGIPECTNRRFGYCGNDLALFATLDRNVITALDDMTRRVGRWLWSQNYIGAFGMDVIVDGGRVYFSEINPRFQGSTSLTTTACEEAGESDLLLDHLAACLGLEPDSDTRDRSLLDWVGLLPPVSQVILHNLEDVNVSLTAPTSLNVAGSLRTHTELVPLTGSLVAPGAILARLVVQDASSHSGYELTEAIKPLVRQMLTAFKPLPSEVTVMK